MASSLLLARNQPTDFTPVLFEFFNKMYELKILFMSPAILNLNVLASQLNFI